MAKIPQVNKKYQLIESKVQKSKNQKSFKKEPKASFKQKEYKENHTQGHYSQTAEKQKRSVSLESSQRKTKDDTQTIVLITAEFASEATET